jgi:hypothetical protein
LDIEFTEWKPFDSKVPEDLSKLTFSYSRDFSYAHPRTTMLMFGPKNAPGKQKQYLYLPHKTNHASSVDGKHAKHLSSLRPRRAMVLTVTQFDGIPMADVFKVLQYWNFDEDKAKKTQTIVKVGMGVFFIKASMFKAQINGGIKDELGVQAKKWVDFVQGRVKEFKSTTAVAVKEGGGAAAAHASVSFADNHDDAQVASHKRRVAVAGGRYIKVRSSQSNQSSESTHTNDSSTSSVTTSSSSSTSSTSEANHSATIHPNSDGGAKIATKTKSRISQLLEYLNISTDWLIAAVVICIIIIAVQWRGIYILTSKLNEIDSKLEKIYSRLEK